MWRDFDYNEIFQNISDSEILKLIKILEEEGLVTDEHKGALSRNLIEYGEEAFKKRVEGLGFNLRIGIVGKFYNNHGSVYGFYNTDIHDYDSAKKHLDKFVENNR